MKKITQLDAATEPLSGTEQFEVVQDGVSKRIAVSVLQAALGGNLSLFTAVINDDATTRTYALTDAGKYIRSTNAGTKNNTVPTQASVAWADDTEIHGRNAGAGALTIAGASGVTVNAPALGTLVIPPQGTYTLKRAALDEWDLIGLTVAA